MSAMPLSPHLAFSRTSLSCSRSSSRAPRTTTGRRILTTRRPRFQLLEELRSARPARPALLRFAVPDAWSPDRPSPLRHCQHHVPAAMATHANNQCGQIPALSRVLSPDGIIDAAKICPVRATPDNHFCPNKCKAGRVEQQRRLSLHLGNGFR